MKSIKVAGASLNQTPLDWTTNLAHIKAAIQSAKKAEVDILCLPELCLTGYGCEDLFLAPWLAKEAWGQLLNLLPHTAGIAVAIGMPLQFQETLYNCICMVEDGRILGFSAKQILANDGVHYESRWFSPWPTGKIERITIAGESYNIGALTYDLKGYKIGLEICEDAWNESRRPALQHFKNNVDIILNPSASHFGLGKANIRKALVSSSSKKFNCLYLYVNLLGNEAGKMIYDGDILFGLSGNIVKRSTLLSFQNHQLLTLDYHKESNFPENALPPVQDQLNQEFTQAVSLALFDYLRKSKSKGFTLSLSGGADSSACAVLIAHMIRQGIKELGITHFLTKIGRPDLIAENKKSAPEESYKTITAKMLTCVYQGTKNSSESTFASAQSLATAIGATFYRWNIDEEVHSYTQKVEDALQRKLTWEADDIALQNIQARARSPIIWMVANIERSLLITTSNRSEGDVGYATMDGDTSGSIAPIAGIDKHFIRQWLKWAEASLGYKGLQAVNALAPSAELRPSEKEQTDEKDLMPYPVIVEIERLAIRERMSPLAVYKALDAIHLEPGSQLKIHVEKFFRLWSRNQWKRERTAPAFHLDDFNIDPRSWCRFPILSGGFEKELEDLRRAD